jgi:Glycosyl transferase family 2
MKLVMAMKVRDEGDVLEDNLRFHHALGVEHFIVTDNRSSDQTVEILERYARAGIATVTREESTNYKDDAIGWMQRMAREASEEHGADWVIHGDADEFWWPVEGTLPDALAEVAPEFGAVSAPRTEFVARPDAAGSFAERMTVREVCSSLRPKLVHRGDPEVVLIDRGAHHLTSEAELRLGADRGPDRAIFRTESDRISRFSTPGVRFATAAVWPLRVLHFPIRSQEQARRRVETFLFGAGFDPRGPARKQLLERHEGGAAEGVYEGLVWSDAEVEEAVDRGWLVHDERLRDLLPRCPDPLTDDAAGSGAIAVAAPPSEVRRERAELELDVMRLNTRFTNELVLARQRLQRRVDELEETQRKLRARVQRLRAGSAPADG